MAEEQNCLDENIKEVERNHYSKLHSPFLKDV